MEIKRKNLTIRPTQAGLLFLAILIAMLLGSINYNNNAGFILVFLLGTMAVISLFHSFRNLTGLQITVMHARPVFMGQSIVFPVSVKTGQVPDLGQALSLGFKKMPPVSFSGQGVVNLARPAAQRGYLYPGDLTLASVYPFGLFRLTTPIPFSGRGLVYPAPVQGRLVLSQAGLREDGDQKADETGPDDFQGLKTYIPGTPMGRVSWKTFSRGQGLFIKDFTADKGQEILMDLALIKGKNLEKKIGLICNSILEAEKQQLRYGLRLGRTLFQPASGKKHMNKCLKALALHGPKTSGSNGRGA